jgi:hypothetical protein
MNEQQLKALQTMLQGIESRSAQAKSAGETLKEIAKKMTNLPQPPGEVGVEVRTLIDTLNTDGSDILEGAENAADTGRQMQALFNQNAPQ